MPATQPGSTRALAAYLVGTVFFLYAFVQRVSPSVMTSELMADFSVGGAALGILSGTYFYTYAAFQLPVGLLVDRYGPRRLLVVAALLSVVASVGFAYSQSLGTASLYRALIGAAVAFPFVCTLTIASRLFPVRRFAMLTGLLLATGMLGAIAGQAPLRLMVESIGWRQTYLALAMLAGLLAVAIVLVVPRISTAGSSGNARAGGGVLQSLVGVLRNKQSVLCALAGFGMAAPMLAFAGLWAVPWLVSTHGVSPVDAGVVVSWHFFGWMVGAPLLGMLSDRLRNRKPVVMAGALVSLLLNTIVVHGGVHNLALIGFLLFAAGVSGGSMVVLYGLAREWNKAEHEASSVALTNMGVVSAGAIMQPVVGLLLDRQWSGQLLDGARVYSPENYRFALSAVLAAILMAFVCCLLMRESNGERQVV